MQTNRRTCWTERCTPQVLKGDDLPINITENVVHRRSSCQASVCCAWDGKSMASQMKETLKHWAAVRLNGGGYHHWSGSRKRRKQQVYPCTFDTKIIWSRCKGIAEKPTRRARQAHVSTLQELRWHNIHWSSTHCRLCMVQGEICPGELAASGILYLYWHIQNRKVHGACCTVTQSAEAEDRALAVCCVWCVLIHNPVKCTHWRHAQFTEVESNSNCMGAVGCLS